MENTLKVFVGRHKWKLSIAVITPLFIGAVGIYVAHQGAEVAEGNRFADDLEARARSQHVTDEAYYAIYKVELQQVGSASLALDATDRYLDQQKNPKGPH